MNQILTTFLLIVSSLHVFGQRFSEEYGIISFSELEMDKYEKDPEATAVVLFDIGETKFVNNINGGYDMIYKRKKRVKVLNAAEAELADISIPFYYKTYDQSEKVREIKATSYNLDNGQIIKTDLQEDGIFEEQESQRVKVKRFAIPNVKGGTVFEFSYSVESPFHFRLPDWEFQCEYPTIKSAYTVGMIPYYEYAVVSQQITEFSRFETTEGDFEVIYEFELNDVPAFYDDEFITSRNDYIKKLDFQLSRVTQITGSTEEILTTWDNMIKELSKENNFGKYAKSAENSFGKDALPTLDIEGSTPTVAIEKIVDHIKTNYIFNRNAGVFARQKLGAFVKSKNGAVGDINLYLVGALRSAGLNAQPVILSTRGHGKIYKEYPFLDKFNYVIAVVKLENNVILLDATDDSLPYNLIPQYCLNDFGLVVEDAPSWINLNSHFYSNKTEMTTIKVAEDSLHISVTQRSTAYDASSERIEYRNDKGSFSDSKLGESEEMLGDLSVKNLDDIQSAFTVRFKKKKPVDKFESEIYIEPFNSIEFTKNPLKGDKRTYPIDMVYLKDRSMVSTLGIPADMTVKSTPKNFQYTDDLLEMSIVVQNLGALVKTTAKYRFKKSIYPPEDYDKLKSDFDELYKMLNQQIVLSPKETN